MDRVIKFRAWDKYRKEIVLHDSLYELQSWNRTREELNNFIFMQFTGIKDRNGREIFEDDIVRINVPNGGDFENTVGRVFWHDEEAAFYHGNSEGRPPKRMWEYVTVIGNVYENPDLLNMTK